MQNHLLQSQKCQTITYKATCPLSLLSNRRQCNTCPATAIASFHFTHLNRRPNFSTPRSISSPVTVAESVPKLPSTPSLIGRVSSQSESCSVLGSSNRFSEVMSFQDIEAGRPINSRRGGYNNGVRKQDATQAVASGIFQINTAVSTFQRLVNTLGTPKDTPALREKLHKTRLHIGQLVKDTSDKLKQASETDHNVGVSASKKITDAKLAKDFQTVLQEYQKAQRLSAERETAYAPFVPQTYLPSLQVEITDPASDIDVSSDRSQEQRALLVDSKRQEVLLLDNEIAFNEAIIEERDQGIQEIQNQIGEVNEIFKDLAVLVHEQGAMIDDIGSNIENSHAATAQAKSHLAKASKTQRLASFW